MSTHPARAAFDRVERLVGRPLERMVGAADSSYHIMAVSRTWLFCMRRVGDLRSGIVHMAALPSERDIRMLSAQITRLQRNVEEVEQRLDDQEMQSRGIDAD
ncbi:MAG: hypothetical protein QM714_07035 [Nocardioides sp.]|uniref:hypothetical protein n=1 Tax=Nocardioides sp. TaxID=35761 RepID=UPI0039E5E4B7